MVRVLVAEDSVTIRELLVEVLRSAPDIEIIGQAKDGVEAVEMTKRLRPDVITMDIKMPRMDGFEATKQIMIEAPTPIVIVSGASNIGDVETSMHALRVGALTVLPRPAGPEAADFDEQVRQFIGTITAMSQVKVVRRWSDQPAVVASQPRTRTSARLRVVAIAASTGGPAALAQILSGLSLDFPVPILVVQHMTNGFMDGFVSWLHRSTSLRVKVAEQGEELVAQTVYLAPDDRHLGVLRGSRIALSNGPAVDGFRPAATFLFESVAAAFGASATAVILTGMGRDGTEGLAAVRRAGGRIIAQDKTSSVVFGMPSAAIEAGLVDEVLPLNAIAGHLIDLAVE